MPRSTDLILWIGLAGIINSICQWLIVTAMSKGHMGTTWALSQSSLLIFYINSIFIWQDAANLRLPIFFTANTLFHFIIVFWKKLKIQKDTIKMSLLWSIVSVCAFLLMFYSLDTLARHGLSRIVFPLGTGICILIFTFYSFFSLRESFNKRSISGIALICCGVAMLAISNIQ